MAKREARQLQLQIETMESPNLHGRRLLSLSCKQHSDKVGLGAGPIEDSAEFRSAVQRVRSALLLLLTGALNCVQMQARLEAEYQSKLQVLETERASVAKERDELRQQRTALGITVSGRIE